MPPEELPFERRWILDPLAYALRVDRVLTDVTRAEVAARAGLPAERLRAMEAGEHEATVTEISRVLLALGHDLPTGWQQLINRMEEWDGLQLGAPPLDREVREALAEDAEITAGGEDRAETA